jgi:hypothetical protein
LPEVGYFSLEVGYFSGFERNFSGFNSNSSAFVRHFLRFGSNFLVFMRDFSGFVSDFHRNLTLAVIEGSTFVLTDRNFTRSVEPFPEFEYVGNLLKRPGKRSHVTVTLHVEDTR